eukprot:CAMPEP_0171343716 /NCGR_PEP_ID=MMETSP0878-20121228/17847_1 /TAXON_ID=67004 /ORGANISM="Thalassiosira weissflogii, Strain CCMP1336" /LENGTH=355 /DNA_ID=CAMNT_0011846729 /DNA_START=141 /DNA_END=1208 /DNA_ORIENTATION=+
MSPFRSMHVAPPSWRKLSSRESSSFTASTFENRELYVDDEADDFSVQRTSPSSSPFSSSSNLHMKVSSKKSRTRSSKATSLTEINNERIRTAGRKGTKKFVDPTKLFIGNLPYDATEEDIRELFAKHWNIPVDMVGERIESINVIRDWKTGVSKGYGFLVFYEPMVATSAMESVRNLKIKGRVVRLDQGKKKDVDEDERLKKKKLKKEKLAREDLDEEGNVIYAALEEAEGSGLSGEEENEGDGDGFEMSEDDMITFMEKGGLRSILPLTEETAGFLGIEGLYEDDDDYFDEYDDEEDENFAYDGVFEEMYDPKEYEGLDNDEVAARESMNREQRRAADKKRKKRKLPFKGFGSR